MFEGELYSLYQLLGKSFRDGCICHLLEHSLIQTLINKGESLLIILSKFLQSLSLIMTQRSFVTRLTIAFFYNLSSILQSKQYLHTNAPIIKIVFGKVELAISLGSIS
jgi:hypothetical protein